MKTRSLENMRFLNFFLIYIIGKKYNLSQNTPYETNFNPSRRLLKKKLFYPNMNGLICYAKKFGKKKYHVVGLFEIIPLNMAIQLHAMELVHNVRLVSKYESIGRRIKLLFVKGF